MELGASHIRGACPSNTAFNLVNTLGSSILGDNEIERLNEGSEELVKWPNTTGYMLTSEGKGPIGAKATKVAYEVYNRIRTEAEEKGGSEPLSTLYSAKVKAALQKADGGKYKHELEMALSGLRNALTAVTGQDLERVRASGMGLRADLPGGDALMPGGADGLAKGLAAQLPTGALRLNRPVGLVDWSLLARDPHLMDKVRLEVTVEDEDGRGLDEEYFADYVICTLPLGVLKRADELDERSQMFYPPLGERKVRSGAAGFGSGSHT